MGSLCQGAAAKLAWPNWPCKLASHTAGLANPPRRPPLWLPSRQGHRDGGREKERERERERKRGREQASTRHGSSALCLSQLPSGKFTAMMSLEVPSGNLCGVLGRFLLKMALLSMLTNGLCTCSSSCRSPSGQFTALSCGCLLAILSAFLQRFLLKATPLRVHTHWFTDMCLGTALTDRGSRLLTTLTNRFAKVKHIHAKCSATRNVSRGWKMKSRKCETNDARKR